MSRDVRKQRSCVDPSRRNNSESGAQPSITPLNSRGIFADVSPVSGDWAGTSR